MNLDPRRPSARLGDRTVDWGRLVLGRDGAPPVKLTPKAAQVLALLLDAEGATVSRSAIFDAVWPGSASSDEVLTQVVKELRRAFGERAGEGCAIETIPKLGYRWAGPRARPADPAPPGPSPTVAPDPLRRVSRAGIAAVALAGIALVAVVVAQRHAPPRALAPLVATPQRLTAEPGADLDPALDPAGTMLAYVHRDGGRAELRVRALGATEHRAVPLPEGGVPSAPAWSPDGRSLAYLWLAHGRCTLHVVALDGGVPQAVADGCPATVPSSIDWLPDGALVYSREVAASDTPAGRLVALYRVVPGQAPVRLTHASARVATDVHPRASADGREIAFVRDGDGANRIVVVDPRGSEREVALPFWPYRVAWAGDALVVAAHAATPAEIWRLSRDGSLEALARDAAGPGFAVARDGARLVYEEHRVDDNVWRVALDGAAAPVALTHTTRGERAPRRAPDGGALAYIGDEGGAPEVYLLLADGTRRRVTRLAPHVPLDLRWSPDGTRLALVVGTEAGKRLVVVGRDGTPVSPAPAVASLAVEQIEFARDGRTLYLAVVAAGRRELARVPYPALDAATPVADFAIAAFAIDRADGALYVARPRADRYERYDVATQALIDTGTPILAAPSDQWLVDGGRVAQLRQVARGGAAELFVGALGTTPVERFALEAPTPFLGRDFELDGDAIVLARRDAAETDLVAIALLPGADTRTAQRRDGGGR